ASPPGIHVLNATYGASCGGGFGNATVQVTTRCDGHQHCSLLPSAVPLARPVTHVPCAPDITVNYKCGTDRTIKNATAHAGHSVELACSYGNGAVIVPGEYIDGGPGLTSSTRSQMHACPAGDLMTGVHAANSQFLCSSGFRPRVANETIDGATQW